MRKVIALIWMMPCVAFAQFVETFDDGDFTNNPTWSGSTAYFTVNASGQLQSNGPAVSDTAWLSTPFTPDLSDTISWQWSWRMDFAPSNNNFSRVYLYCTEPALFGQGEGYFLRLGENGSTDALKLYKYSGSTETLLATGTTGYSMSPDLRVKIRRYPGGLWEIESDSLGSGAFITECTVMDSSFTNPQYFGMWCKYSSGNSAAFYFDDIHADSLPPDTLAPHLMQAVPGGPDQLLLTFDEALDAVSAENTGNYLLSSGMGNPITATLDLVDSMSVNLQFSNPFPQGQGLTIAVSGVADAAGNAMAGDSIAFVYYHFIAPAYRSLVINEIMADPSPVKALPETEFIEIFNADTGYIDLTGLRLSDLTSEAVLDSSLAIAPGEYIILCHTSDVSLFSGMGKTVGLPAFPTLNNASDELTLKTDEVVTDRVAYSDQWYRDDAKKIGGYSLEQINPKALCSGQGNWIASNASAGGSPGNVNSVFDLDPDTTAPRVVRAYISGSMEISLDLDEDADSATVQSSDFQLNGLGIAQALINYPYLSVKLVLSDTIEFGKVYFLQVGDFTDCWGNAISDTTLVLGIGANPGPKDLVITEIYAAPDPEGPLPNAEYIEVYNRSNTLISTDKVDLSDPSTGSSMYSELLMPGEYAIVCDDGHTDLFKAMGKVIAVTSMPSLNNSGDRLRLMFNETIIDEVNYLATWHSQEQYASGGHSLERKMLDDLCGLETNWTTSTSTLQGTPGRINSVNQLGTPPPVKLSGSDILAPDLILLKFSGALDTNFQAEVRVNGVQSQGHFNPSLNQIEVNTAEPLERGIEHALLVDQLADCTGKPLTAQSLKLYLHDSGDVVINEVLFNPRDNGTDFVELHNTTPFPIEISNWSLAYFDSSDSLRLNKISKHGLVLPPGAYIALNEDNENLLLNYPFSSDSTLYEMDLPSMPNDEGRVMVMDGMGIQMDRMNYDEAMHFALIKDADGVSLERLSPVRPASDRSNWHSAASTENYGTPGYTNSQEYGSLTTSATVSLSQEFISPDNDGYQDVVNIDYHFNQPGYVISITVFNDLGVPIRTLANNEITGGSGTYTWDGINNDGEKALTGIHLILVEAFNLKNEKLRFRLPVVVVSRL